VLDLRNAMFERLLALPTRYYDDSSSGALISKVAHDVVGVTSAATGVLTVLVRDTLAVAGLLGWLLYLNWRLTLVTLVIAPGVAIVVKVFSKRMRRMSREGLRAQIGRASGRGRGESSEDGGKLTKNENGRQIRIRQAWM